MGNTSIVALRLLNSIDVPRSAAGRYQLDSNANEPMPPGWNNGGALDVNAAGVSVGFSNGDGRTVLSPAQWFPLGSYQFLSSDQDLLGEARAISDPGRIVGWIRQDGRDEPFWLQELDSFNLLGDLDLGGRALCVSERLSPGDSAFDPWIGGYVNGSAGKLPAYWQPGGTGYTLNVLPGWEAGRTGFVTGITRNGMTGVREASTTSPADVFVYRSGWSTPVFLPSSFGPTVEMGVADFDTGGDVVAGNATFPYLWLNTSQPGSGAAIDFAALVEPRTDLSFATLSGIANANLFEETPPQFAGAGANGWLVFSTDVSEQYSRIAPDSATVVTGESPIGNEIQIRYPDADWMTVTRQSGPVTQLYPVRVQIDGTVGAVPTELWVRATVRTPSGGAFRGDIELFNFQTSTWDNGVVDGTGAPAEFALTTDFRTHDRRTPNGVPVSQYVNSGTVRARVVVRSLILTDPNASWAVAIDQASWVKK